MKKLLLITAIVVAFVPVEASAGWVQDMFRGGFLPADASGNVSTRRNLTVRGTLIVPSSAATSISGTLNGYSHFRTLCVPFVKQNVAAGQTSQTLFVSGLTDHRSFVLPVASSVVGMSVLANHSPTLTSGTLTLRVTVDGTQSNLLKVGLNSVDDLYTSHTTVGRGSISVGAGKSVGVTFTTSSGWLPTTSDIVVMLLLTY